MPKLFDRVEVNTSTTGTGDVTFGSVVSNAFLTPTEAGCADTDTVRYVIVDGTDYEEGIGTIKSSVAAMARTTVTKSKIGGTAGTTKLNLSGTAVIAFVASAADIVNKADVTTVGNALLTAADAAAGQTAIGGTTVGKALFTATDAAAARTATGVDKLAPIGHLWGLTLSNNTSDATHDIDIAAGEAADASGNLMKLASGLTKQIDATWAVGTNQGGLDAGTVTTGIYHVHLIQRSDTGVVDVLFSLSAGGPTLPTNYDRSRRIGTVIYSGGLKAFKQYGDEFYTAASALDYNNSSLGTTRALVVLSVPLNTTAIVNAYGFNSSSGCQILVHRADATDVSPSSRGPTISAENANGGQSTELRVPVNSSSQIAVRADRSGCTLQLNTLGWVDTRGRLG